MRVLFVCSGNKGISPIVSGQARSLSKTGIEIFTYGIVGKGILGYLKSIPSLRKQILTTNVDIVHAHYSFSAIAASFSTRKPVVCSLMGSDVKCSGIWRFVIRFFAKRVWSSTIVKSYDMKLSLGLDSVNVIPNGVDLDLFKPMNKAICKVKVGWDLDKKVVLFAANPARPEKNYKLAISAVKALGMYDVELIAVHGINHAEMPVYMNAAEVLLLTSLWEGSPNVVKEAMACNLPVVSTDVGDVAWLFGKQYAGFVCPADPSALSKALMTALLIKEPTQFRETVSRRMLDKDSINSKIVALYNIVAQQKS